MNIIKFNGAKVQKTEQGAQADRYFAALIAAA